MGIKYLPESNEYANYWYIDIEADSLKPTRIWVLCASRMDSNEVHSFVGHDAIRRFFDEAEPETIYVGHNILSYDGPAIARLVGRGVSAANSVDTLVLSYLYNPGIAGGHSLHAWGDRFGDAKIEFKDFGQYTPEMDRYCQQDVKLGKKVFKGLVSRMRKLGFSERSCEIEHKIREVIDEQQRNGWYFDIPGAQALAGRLRGEQGSLEGPIRELFPPRLAEVGSYVRRTKADGGEFASYLRHLEQFPDVRDNGDGTYSTYDWEEFNIGSPKQRVERLLSLGWEPVDFTEKGFPKVDEESLLAFAELSGRPEARAIAEWLVLQGRSSMIDTWLNNVNYDDSCMHGRVMTCGAATRRMTHNSPNTANIPKAKEKVKYGIECRRLWRARPGRKQVGYDASGLEMRMFAEYLANDAATILFTTGDPHIVNTRNLGLPDEMRDITVKNGFYAYLYGAGDAKLGRTLRPELQGSEARDYGKVSREILEKGTPGLARLVADIQDEYRQTGGLLKTIDGGYVRCGSVSAALNYKLQSAGAIVMKEAAIIARDKVRERGLDSMLVGTIHDEGQNDASEKDADEVGRVCVQSIRDAGESLGFHVPLDGNYKVGDNWAECH